MSKIEIEKHLSAISTHLLFVLVLLLPGHAWAHGLEIRLFPDGNRLIGQVVYEDGSPWFAETVTIENLTDTSVEPQTVTTDSAGGFSVTGVLGNDYRIRAADDTGHVTEVSMTLDGTASSTTAATSLATEPGGGIPFYVIAGALLLLSIIPARYLQRRRGNRA